MDDDGYDYIGTPADHDPAGPPVVGVILIVLALVLAAFGIAGFYHLLAGPAQ